VSPGEETLSRTPDPDGARPTSIAKRSQRTEHRTLTGAAKRPGVVKAAPTLAASASRDVRRSEGGLRSVNWQDHGAKACQPPW
jgi:hypothetical protein